MRDALRAAPRIQISRTDSTVMLVTPQGNRILFTDNREVTVPITASLDSKVKCKWDKNKLVIESQTDAGVKTIYTYEPDGDQLRVNVRIEVRQPRRVVLVNEQDLVDDLEGLAVLELELELAYPTQILADQPVALLE